MTPTISNNQIQNIIFSFGDMIAQNIPKMLLILAALIGLYWGICKFLKGVAGPGSTSWLGSHWAWYDRMTYRPYKGYNRLRSRNWNKKHTA